MLLTLHTKTGRPLEMVLHVIFLVLVPGLLQAILEGLLA